MEMMPDDFPFREQLRILIETVTAPDGSQYSTVMVAKATGLSEQGLLYMLDGRTQNPRLDSLRRICSFYRISLDYFECGNETECRTFLAQNAARQASPLVCEIDQEADELTYSARSKVLRLVDRLRFLRGSGKH